MTVKDIKLKYCVGVLPINMVFAHNVEENAKRLNDAYNCKGSEELVTNNGKQPSVCGILCGGDSIKKDLTSEERVSQEIKEIIKESPIVKYNRRLIVETGNGLEATGDLLDKIKSDFKDNTLLTEMNIGDQYLYFFTKEGLKTGYFVKINECKECRDIVSKNFKDILKNRNQFKVTVEGDNVIIESKKESNGLGFMNDFNNDQSNPIINTEQIPSSINSSKNFIPQDPVESMDNSSNRMEEANQLGLEENNEKNSDNGGNNIMPKNVDINPENNCFNSDNPADTGYENPYNNSNNSEKGRSRYDETSENNDSENRCRDISGGLTNENSDKDVYID